MHGQSEYTESKQQQLRGLLEACRFAWNDKTWAHPTRLFLDCMAGSGHTEEGNPGSPIIMQDFARQNMPDAMCVWCDVEPEHTKRLATFQRPPTHLLTGRYQDVMRAWLAGYASSSPGKLMGVVYLDDNGCRQIWDDGGFLKWVMQSHPYLDVAIHFSETAWRRSNGVGFDWAKKENVLDVLKLILRYKPAAVIYAPRNKHLWRLVYGVKSHKMNLTGSERTKLNDYIAEQEVEQHSLFS